MSYYKKQYTQEEVNEIIDWLNNHMDQFPKRLQLSDAILIEDLPKTLSSLMYNAKSNYRNVSFSGLICKLFAIKDVLEKQVGG
jgi:hypothetical protein